MALPYSTGNIKKAEETAQLLSEAINTGEKANAIRYVEQLLMLKVPVCVQLTQEAYSQECIRYIYNILLSDSEILRTEHRASLIPCRLRVGVEDALSDALITMLVTPGMTISELKQKTCRDYGFHPSLQCWIIGKRFAKDEDTLFSHNVVNDDDQAFLFIRSAQSANLSREQQKQDEQDRRIGGIIENIEVLSRGPAETGTRQKQPQVSPVGKPYPKLRPKPVLGWSCLKCTYVNKPTRPGCAICSASRPENYTIPDMYQPDEEEIHRIRQEELASLQYQQSIIEEREKNFLTLLETDNQDLVSNTEEICCPICCEQILAGEGATLRECLHSFCRECVKMTIQACIDAEVACPYADGEYSCDCKLQDREIKTLLSLEDYQKFLELRLNIAETRSENSYHCKTLDCPGWCIFEDDVNEFDCIICNKINCLLCKAIHINMNCKEYQDDLQLRAENDAAAKRTTEELQRMLQNGEAMCCPKCNVIIQKKDGCDWICCLMCKTEICWVTKQARWGPKGHGDTSGGCKCQITVAPCHPKCQNCH